MYSGDVLRQFWWTRFPRWGIDWSGYFRRCAVFVCLPNVDARQKSWTATNHWLRRTYGLRRSAGLCPNQAVRRTAFAGGRESRVSVITAARLAPGGTKKTILQVLAYVNLNSQLRADSMGTTFRQRRRIKAVKNYGSSASKNGVCRHATVQAENPTGQVHVKQIDESSKRLECGFLFKPGLGPTSPSHGQS